MKELILIFISTTLINNFVLYYFLGICPFLGISNKIESALGMGIAVVFVMTFANAISWLVYHLVLAKLGLGYLAYVSFILIIACLVQMVEMIVRKVSPPLYQALGIFLPLITVNCAILGAALLMITVNYNFIKSVVFGFAGGVGFLIIICLMAGIREELDFADVPKVFQGAAITLIITGLIALVFMGFAGLIST